MIPPFDDPTAAHTRARRGRALLLGLGAGFIAALALLIAAPTLRDAVLLVLPSTYASPTASSENPAQELQRADRRLAALERDLARRVPNRPYLVVNATTNTFRLMRSTETVREGFCSTGSYVQLKGSDGREWLFETPRGLRRIQNKRTNPVWTKPDWAFVEAGLPVPPLGSAARVERGVLGAYALGLGDGYLIHGTPYQRLLGRPVTHGCIRLGDADLEAVYRALPVGASVYIY